MVPVKYSIKIAADIRIWVKGSVDGVRTAPIIVELSIIYFQEFNICREETIFNIPIIICVIR